MNCDEFKIEYIVAPNELSSEAGEHLKDCEMCQAFVQTEEQFNKKLSTVINVDVPEGFRHKLREYVVKKNQPFWSLSRASLALAASLVMAIGLVNVYQSSFLSPQQGIEHLLVQHIEHDVQAFKTSHQIDPEHLVEVEKEFGVRVNLPKMMNYAEKCPIGDSYGLHMVYESDNKLITVIYMPEIKMSKVVEFNYSGLKGWVKPLERGSIAIVGGSTIDLPKEEERIKDAIEWL